MKLNLQKIRIANLVLTATGTAIFLSLFFYISLAPKDFDQRVRDIAISKVRSEVNIQLSNAAGSQMADRASELAGRISGKLQSRVETMREQLDSGMDEMIADILAASCKLDCERRDAAAKAVRSFYESSIIRHTFAIDRVENLVTGKYDEVMGELRTDLKIFSGSTAFALIFALILSIVKGRAAAHILPISLALTGATLIVVSWYIFGQDWVTTILFSSYWGTAYCVLLAILSSFMIDIAANKARVTSFIFNMISIPNISFVPC